MTNEGPTEYLTKALPRGTICHWLLERVRRLPRPKPRLALLERIVIAPRQSIALIEAEGRKLLVATAPEGAPTFYALEGQHAVRATFNDKASRAWRRSSW